MKKFSLSYDYVKSARNIITYKYGGSTKEKIKPGMRKIVLRGDRQFNAIAGFELQIMSYKGFDPFMNIQSDQNGMAVLDVYLGQGAVKFIYIVDDVELEISSSISDEDQNISLTTPHQKRVTPHWWQRLGFYG